MVRTTTTIMLASAALALPLGAYADPPAAAPPGIPPVFVGAPTTQQGGEFTLNFTGTGRFEGIGRPDEHARPFPLTPGQARRQARAQREASNAAANSVFLTFLRQLRTMSTLPRSR